MSKAALIALATSVFALAAEAPAPGPQFTDDLRLQRPADYREWVFLSSGLGMTYGPLRDTEGSSPRFDNVFVNPAAYREFVKTGKWPDRTMFVLEVRASAEKASINRGGRTQGPIVGVEAEVKDARLPDQWGYFSFPASGEPAKAFPKTAGCYACHTTNAAVENTFAQFYPTILEIAKSKGTVKASYHDE